MMIFGEKLCEIHVILRYKCRSLTNVICDLFLLASRLREPKFTKNMIDHGRINSNQLDRAVYDRIQTCQFWEHLHWWIGTIKKNRYYIVGLSEISKMDQHIVATICWFLSVPPCHFSWDLWLNPPPPYQNLGFWTLRGGGYYSKPHGNIITTWPKSVSKEVTINLPCSDR